MDGYYYRINTKTWFLDTPVNGYVKDQGKYGDPISGAYFDRTMFNTNDGRRFWVCYKPGVVRTGNYSCLWLPERDDAKAYKIFYDYYKKLYTPKIQKMCIALNELKINAHCMAGVDVEEKNEG